MTQSQLDSFINSAFPYYNGKLALEIIAYFNSNCTKNFKIILYGDILSASLFALILNTTFVPYKYLNISNFIQISNSKKNLFFLANLSINVLKNIPASNKFIYLYCKPTAHNIVTNTSIKNLSLPKEFHGFSYTNLCSGVYKGATLNPNNVIPSLKSSKYNENFAYKLYKESAKMFGLKYAKKRTFNKKWNKN